MTFPVVHSTLDPKALTREIETRYALNGPVRCQLMSRANNDFYAVNVEGERFALRVAKADFRSRDEYAFEAAYVNHLHDKGCNVPAAIPASDGSLFFEVKAPDGARAITLMRWLEAKPFTKHLTVADARDMGAGLAHLHDAGQDFESTFSRDLSTADALGEYLPELLSMLVTDPEHHDFYAEATQRVQAALATISAESVRRGPVHGDYQFANVLRTDAGTIAVLDFDTCGMGYCAEDLLTFVWRSDMEIRDERVNEAFLSGYEEIRPLLDAERTFYPIFRVARDLYMSATFAMLINRVGPVPGFDGDFAPFTELVRQHLADASRLGSLL
jgi:Ser/Thr protein kinase RdoA (MazF antagonist)